jgi:hypothetical protein
VFRLSHDRSRDVRRVGIIYKVQDCTTRREYELQYTMYMQGDAELYGCLGAKGAGCRRPGDQANMLSAEATSLRLSVSLLHQRSLTYRVSAAEQLASAGIAVGEQLLSPAVLGSVFPDSRTIGERRVSRGDSYATVTGLWQTVGRRTKLDGQQYRSTIS